MDHRYSDRIRIVTATSLFDGHDAAINIMRRIMQSKGAEIIHLGHNRSVREIVECAIEEDAHGIAITSYQGGHIEFFRYIKDLLTEAECQHIKIFGGGGGTILPSEIDELHRYGITRIYSPDDGRSMGLEGMIDDLLTQCRPTNSNADFRNAPAQWNGRLPIGETKDIRLVARAITDAENDNGQLAPHNAMHPQAHRTQRKNREKQIPESSATHPENKQPRHTAPDAMQARDSETQTTASSGTHPENDQSRHTSPDVMHPQNNAAEKAAANAPVLGITGTGGSGKSSITDEIVRRLLNSSPTLSVAVISVDPSRKRTGGALLGDRIRMNAVSSPRVFMRSLATREENAALSSHVQEAIFICKNAGYNIVILESAGTGQSDTAILDFCNISLYVMTPEYGAASQLEKINMLDYADLIIINKSDKAGAEDALNEVRRQYKRNHAQWNAANDQLPIFSTIAAQFNDAGVNQLFSKLLTLLKLEQTPNIRSAKSSTIIPARRVRYLSEIADANRSYDQWATEQAAIASKLYRLEAALEITQEAPAINKAKNDLLSQLDPSCKTMIESWPALQTKYRSDMLEYTVRNKTHSQPLTSKTISGTSIHRVLLPQYRDWGDILQWQLQENIPGSFPYTAGVFELRREGEDPTRMFAGEGGPERTNKRFHYVSEGQPAKRLSTAFDSVTLYGEDPDERPDIFGKIGNAGVSIATVDDAKKLYSGFDLCDPKTSVSMTINGPAPMLLAFFMNAAIDQQCEKYIEEHGLWDRVQDIAAAKYKHDQRPLYHNPAAAHGLGLGLLGLSGDEVLPPEIYASLKQQALSQVRGTVQADILKEDQAQNTCIFSTEFALRLMGDVQEFFIEHSVRNFYSVSISGYHIAEAGANPITQLAFTLANGFTYLEYYLARGMHIDDFAPNLSFFFSNGMDAEYSVIGRVARRIWAKAIRYIYKGNERSQKLKYHIQTSGRSLHAQEIDFNDIRTTLQALYAIYDNCNSLHTNAYDEAITTPTEESVRRAMAIQLIINRELGSSKNENPTQGSFLTEELTALVEEAVLSEFDRLTERGGVLGAMERMYQRNRIQEESLYYESLKHSGELPIVGVNTFLNRSGSPTVMPGEVIRSTLEEKEQQISNLRAFKKRNAANSTQALEQLKETAISNGNIFSELMNTVKYCTLGKITHALYEVGGQYRRNM